MRPDQEKHLRKSRAKLVRAMNQSIDEMMPYIEVHDVGRVWLDLDREDALEHVQKLAKAAGVTHEEVQSFPEPSKLDARERARYQVLALKIALAAALRSGVTYEEMIIADDSFRAAVEADAAEIPADGQQQLLYQYKLLMRYMRAAFEQMFFMTALPDVKVLRLTRAQTNQYYDRETHAKIQEQVETAADQLAEQEGCFVEVIDDDHAVVYATTHHANVAWQVRTMTQRGGTARFARNASHKDHKLLATLYRWDFMR